jgi:predicted MFS family arabinose efflux permease
MIATFLIEKQAENPIIKLSYFRNKQIVVAGTIAVATGILQSSFVFIPDFAVGAFQIEASEASFMLVPLVLATAIGSPMFGRLIDLYGSKIIILIGLLLAAAGFYLLHLSMESKTLFYTSGVLIGLGLSVLSGSSLRYIMLNETSMVDRAVTQGMLTIFHQPGATHRSLTDWSDHCKQGQGRRDMKMFSLYQSLFLILIVSSAFLLKNRRSELQAQQQ